MCESFILPIFTQDINKLIIIEISKIYKYVNINFFLFVIRNCNDFFHISINIFYRVNFIIIASFFSLDNGCLYFNPSLTNNIHFLIIYTIIYKSFNSTCAILHLKWKNVHSQLNIMLGQIILLIF